jgi:uncharacterized membrane protein YkoI
MTRTKKLLVTAGVVAAVCGGGAIAVAQQDSGPPDLDRASQAALEEAGDGHVVGVEQDEDGTYDVEVRHPDGSETDVDLSADFRVVYREFDGRDDDDDDRVLDEATRTSASDAALAAVGDGTVVSVEADDGVYQVEIRQADGTETDVYLDAEFNVVGTDVDRVDGVDRDDDDDRILDEATRTQAGDAALAVVGDGTVVSVEADDGGYDVEIRHANGTETDVHLDAEFNVVPSALHDD